jgi:hypothetical protein
MTNLEHSNVVGGSTARKRLHCAASYQLELNVPEPPTSDFAARGSMLHAAMELLLTADPRSPKDVEAVLDELEGQDLGFEGHEITRELIDDKLRPALDAWFRLDKEFGFVDFWLEQRLSLEAIIEGAFGTGDVIALDKHDTVHNLDWKFGDGVPVDVEENESMAFYGGGVLHDPEDEMLELRRHLDVAHGEAPIPFMFHIVQPRAGFDDDPLQSWATDEDWIESFLDQLAEAVDRARLPDPQPKTGDWCKWCRAKSVCPAQQQLVLATEKKNPEIMTGVELAECLAMADRAYEWANEIYAVALRELENGAQVPGWKLVQKRATRKWTDEDAVVEICRKSKVKVDDMYNRKLKSPAQLEKSAKNVFAKKLHKMVHSVSSGVTIAPESDKRPAITDPMALLAETLEISK